MTQYMLLFSLGPVQSFIAQARKTRDLWLGSYLLSTLMEAGMKGIEQSLVFPSTPRIDKNIPDLPNKFIAIFNSKEEAQKCATESQKRIEACWNLICQNVWDTIIQKYAQIGKKNPELIWKRQTDPAMFFEIFWVIVEGEDTHYPTWLEKTQAALDARKRLRYVRLEPNVTDISNQSDIVGGINEPGEKSTISGDREALHHADTEGGTSRDVVRTFWRELGKRLLENSIKHDLNQEGEERLDAIDTVKRFAYRSPAVIKNGRNANFPSTSSIATATYVEQLVTREENSSLSSAIAEWLDKTNKLDMMDQTIPFLAEKVQNNTQQSRILARDGDCYFPETFTAYRLKKDYNITPINTAEQVAEQGRDALRKLLKETEALKITRPTPYYAMIQMDGDRMGKLLSGVKDKNEHVKISRALSTFARKTVPSIVEKAYPGRLIYAGGDDVFALAPLARDNTRQDTHQIWNILDLVNQLQLAYCTELKSEVSDVKRKDSVTASIGIAIAHHYTSLSYVRRMSKEAEDLAKKHYGRNSLVVTVLRRSGEQTRVGCRWQYDTLKNEAQPINLFNSFYQFFKQDVLSPKCVYNLLEEASTLVELDPAVQMSEIKRVLKRQQSSDKPETITEQAEHIVNLAEAMNRDERQTGSDKKGQMSIDLHSNERRYGLVEVLGWLLVVVFLTRKEQD